MSIETNRPKGLASRRDFLRWGATSSALSFAAPGSKIDAPGQVQRYNVLGRTGEAISDISFGAATLRPGGERLVHLAMDRGINYFDTAESYGEGRSEITLGRALKGRRDKVVITSKVITKPRTTESELMSRLEASLRRLQVNYVDIFMNHAVNNVDVMKNPEWHTFVTKAKEQGKIRFAGMSGHAGRLIDCLHYVFDNDLVDVVLVAHNFGQDPKFYEGFTSSFDFVANQVDLPQVLAKGKAKDVGIAVMKTLRGARLNDMRPYETADVTYAQAALRWALSSPHVDTAVITINSATKIDEYLAASGWRKLAAGDRDLLERYVHLNRDSYCVNVCNDCEHACPYGVPIADVLRTRMYAVDYQDLRQAREEYALLETNASACLSCSGKPCAKVCSHGIPVDKLCEPTHAYLVGLI